MPSERYCLDCNEILHGRADKKFCNDQCRNNYNNQLNSDSYNLVRNINNILKRNRRILEELNPTGKTKTTRKKLSSKGFNFSKHTSIYQTKTGANYIFCYEYGYLLLDGEDVLLVKREDKDD
ncbi:hypothetical protein [Mucilaginibacter paludis]|uniref:DUF2116 family Zn-ribbon domain-containing protein n=1 Tax=Mucilaginibacter paludis DSM 18603 TaxID=714943 RepID=H1Y6X2_9SPHI|nr:hypothetical protein [Mucilaginibacter paludis]EHQ28379.1 hypothetical protein Mucpa_4289 [Mucilaginibacter paludis DSM 18603]